MDLLKSIAHPEEVYALLKYKIGSSSTNGNYANSVGFHVIYISSVFTHFYM